MKKTILFLTLAFFTTGIFAQKKTTSSAVISFDASTSLDNMPKAENKTAIGALDTKTGSIAFEATVKNFTFSNPTMQGHFNGDKWLNSDTYPSFTFKGNIVDLSTVNFGKDGSYKTEAEGTLTVKGKDKKIKVPGTIVVKGETISVSSDFTIDVDDFDIAGTPINAGKVSGKPKIKVNAEFK
jgi:polyisoprenoid-binding protein YceI